jgi:hypothetical protein
MYVLRRDVCSGNRVRFRENLRRGRIVVGDKDEIRKEKVVIGFG